MLAGLDPRLRPFAEHFVRALEVAGLRPRVTSAFRSRQRQAVLYDRYRRGMSGGLPAAPPGRSLHEQGRAFDLVVTPPEYAPYVGAYWREYGGRWFPSDYVHFEA